MQVKGRSVVLVLFVVLSGLSGWSFMSLPILPLLFVSGSLYRYLNDLTVQLWCRIPAAVIEVLWGAEVRVCGDRDRLASPSLLVMNHRTRFDWVFLWNYLIKRGDMLHCKIVLKKGIKRLPMYGWGTQVAGFLFLSRRWSEDEDMISEYMKFNQHTNYPLQLLLFPEGTDLSPSNKLKSEAFAVQQNFPQYKQLLQPRFKGFIKSVKELSAQGYLDSVVDITVAYGGPMPHNEWDILAGRWPDSIHFHIRQYSVEELPIDDEQQLEQWLRMRWDEKEKRLEHFYKHGEFAANYSSIPNDNRAVQLTCVLLFWIFFDLISIYVMVTYWYLYLPYLLIGTCFFLWLSHQHDGVERLERKRRLH